MRTPKVVISALALSAILGIGAASAADMAVKAPVYKAAPVMITDWTGWYVGLNAGAALDDSSYSLNPAGCFLTGCGVGGVAANPNRTFTGSLHNAAFTGGAQVGYNRQMGIWLWGVEADINYDGINQTNANNTLLTGPLAGGNALNSLSQRLDWFGTVRGRLGFVPSPNVLLYATGGLAYGHVSSSTNVLFPITCCGGDNYVGSGSSVRAGWTVGGGGEWMVSPGWSVKAEYLYVDLGRINYADPCITAGAVCGGVVPPAYQTSLTSREHVARVGLNYHFGAPVVPQY